MKTILRTGLTYIVVTMLAITSCTKEPEGEKVTDIDGNVYYTIQIGDQIWLKENLKAVRTLTGSNITYAPTTTLWSSSVSAYCNIKNEEDYTNPYGKLYKFQTAANNNICPDGWRVPTLADWNQLITYLGGSEVAGGKLKQSGTDNWNIPNTRGTNESRFTALPGGYRSMSTSNAGFSAFHADGYYWSSTPGTNNTGYAVSMSSTSGAIFVSTYDSRFGMSVRCIKNNESN